jgi:hypothetical protein
LQAKAGWQISRLWLGEAAAAGPHLRRRIQRLAVGVGAEAVAQRADLDVWRVGVGVRWRGGGASKCEDASWCTNFSGVASRHAPRGNAPSTPDAASPAGLFFSAPRLPLPPLAFLGLRSSSSRPSYLPVGGFQVVNRAIDCRALGQQEGCCAAPAGSLRALAPARARAPSRWRHVEPARERRAQQRRRRHAKHEAWRGVAAGQRLIRRLALQAYAVCRPGASINVSK